LKGNGFSLVELIAVLLIIGIVGVATSRAFVPSATFQVQSSRDLVVTAFFSAQQRAMAQQNTVRLIVTSPTEIDIREDTDNDGSFADESSLYLAGTQYPVNILPNQTLNSTTFEFDRLGRTTASTLSLTQDSVIINVSVSATGNVL